MENINIGKSYRTASIDYLEVTAMYADFSTKSFGAMQVNYFGDIADSDAKILKTISDATGKVFQAITEKNVVSKLYRISTADYVKVGECIGEARERKSHQ